MTDSSNKESQLPSEDETKISDREEGDQETVSNRVKEAGQSFRGMITSLGDKAKTITEKTHELKDRSVESISHTRRDAHDIQALGAKVEAVITVFEETMTHIERQEYDEQENLLNAYKKLLEEEINVIRSRLELVKRIS
jgi:hypothetical protein